MRNQIQIIIKSIQTNVTDFLVRILPEFIRMPLTKVFRRIKQARVAPQREKLYNLVNECSDYDRLVIFPPSLDWYTQLFQRPQQLALALARQGALVFYVQPKNSGKLENYTKLEERLFLCEVPVETFWCLKEPTIYILTWNRKYINGFEAPKVIYDYVDEIETFYGNHSQMYKDHDKLIGKSELVVTTAKRLYDQVEKVRKDALLCPNGVDYEHFVSMADEDKDEFIDIYKLADQDKRIIGYYGALARWFDYDLVRESARLRPDYSFVLIGPDYDGSLRSEGLLDQNNIHWLGVKPYSHIPAYLRFFDVAMIPFKLNNITHSTSPLKLFEYMAGGKPVVITAMHESMRTEGVLVADNAEDFIARIDQALELSSNDAYLHKIDQVARNNTWDIRARQIIDALHEKSDRSNE